MYFHMVYLTYKEENTKSDNDLVCTELCDYIIQYLSLQSC